MASLLESSLTSNSIRRLQRRHSYIAATRTSHHRQQRRQSKKELLHDTALRFFCPALWLTPAIVRAREKSEYEKDRKRVQEVYVGYQENQKGGQEDSVGGTRGRVRKVAVKDLLDTYPAPLEWELLEDPLRDPWPYETLTEEDPWLLPPIEKMV